MWYQNELPERMESWNRKQKCAKPSFGQDVSKKYGNCNIGLYNDWICYYDNYSLGAFSWCSFSLSNMVRGSRAFKTEMWNVILSNRMMEEQWRLRTKYFRIALLKLFQDSDPLFQSWKYMKQNSTKRTEVVPYGRIENNLVVFIIIIFYR